MVAPVFYCRWLLRWSHLLWQYFAHVININMLRIQKTSLFGCFGKKILYKWRFQWENYLKIVYFPLPCLITGGYIIYPHSPTRFSRRLHIETSIKLQSSLMNIKPTPWQPYKKRWARMLSSANDFYLVDFLYLSILSNWFNHYAAGRLNSQLLGSPYTIHTYTKYHHKNSLATWHLESIPKT